MLQEGKELLGDEELEKTRGQTEALKEAINTSPEKPHIPRDNTMVVTAQVRECWHFSSRIVLCLQGLVRVCLESLKFNEGSHLHS